ncbi:MAG TPA: UDP-N-acetylmuramoyl-tripeptide--D-alanyl-D-alanine ligase [Gammaproteobacteria bacterium]|nr:UDP-N-acetylmuramoyl-tripeptide--D-alanyl-D-alanine ligase [Gammaproteobacteria bacterium]
MIAMSLSRAAEILEAERSGADVEFRGVSTDTRTLEPGNLFVALQGPNFDGHDYLQQAFAGGAVAALLGRGDAGGLPQLLVGDTRLALGRLAAAWRSTLGLPLIGVTGSNGKTTVKEMLAAILRQRGEVLVTRGNLNNDIGVPLTLFDLSPAHDYAVVEMGANHPREIAYLAAVARPTVGLVTNAAAAHLEGFGSVEGVARSKGELFESLPPEGVAVINADDDYAGLWRTLAAPRRLVDFGLDRSAQVTADWRGDLEGSELDLHTPAGSVRLRLPLPGRHNVMNALAATAAAVALEVPLDAVAAGLGAVQTVSGRWQRQAGANGALLVDDSYNANPASLRAALQLLAQTKAESWLVLGDMGELGEAGEQLHRRMGEEAREAGIRRLFAFGPLARQAAESFGPGGESFSELEALNATLREAAHEGVIILVKGSRAMRMERVVEALGISAADGHRGVARSC